MPITMPRGSRQPTRCGSLVVDYCVEIEVPSGAGQDWNDVLIQGMMSHDEHSPESLLQLSRHER